MPVLCILGKGEKGRGHVRKEQKPRTDRDVKEALVILKRFTVLEKG